MLLRRLVEYADATAAAGSGDEVPKFYARKPVRFVLDIATDGTFLGLTDHADKTDRARRFGVERPVPAITRTVGVSPAIAVDNIEYVFGWSDDDGKRDRVAKQYQAFRDLNDEWAMADPAGPASAIAAFYRTSQQDRVTRPNEFARGDLVAFLVDGQFASRTPSAAGFWAGVAGDRKGSGDAGLCLVCGQIQPLLKTIPQQIPRRLLPGATQSASLVSVNEAVHGYELQKFLGNTPICADCGLKFMSALTGLLDSGKHSVVLPGQNARLAWCVVGGSTYDPWGSLNQPHEVQIQTLLGAPVAGDDTGSPDHDDLSTYCSVTVGGNVARVVVRDWVEMPLPQVKRNIADWLRDHEIIDHWTGEVSRVKLRQLALATGRWQPGRNGAKGTWKDFGKSGEDRPSDIFHALLRSAIQRRPLPPKLLNHVINRIQADGRVDTARVALIRLALIRRDPTRTEAERERLTPVLNNENNTPAYISGQIFAVLDQLQHAVSQAADQKLNTTFSDRYFNRAMMNPRAALVTGRRTATAWLKRLRGPLHRPGQAHKYLERLDDLYHKVDAQKDVPGIATLTQKSQFILGYHHQRAALRAEYSAASSNKGKSDLPPSTEDTTPDTTSDITSDIASDTEGAAA